MKTSPRIPRSLLRRPLSRVPRTFALAAWAAWVSFACKPRAFNEGGAVLSHSAAPVCASLDESRRKDARLPLHLFRASPENYARCLHSTVANGTKIGQPMSVPMLDVSTLWGRLDTALREARAESADREVRTERNARPLRASEIQERMKRLAKATVSMGEFWQAALDYTLVVSNPKLEYLGRGAIADGASKGLREQNINPSAERALRALRDFEKFAPALVVMPVVEDVPHRDALLGHALGVHFARIADWNDVRIVDGALADPFWILTLDLEDALGALTKVRPMGKSDPLPPLDVAQPALDFNFKKARFEFLFDFIKDLEKEAAAEHAGQPAAIKGAQLDDAEALWTLVLRGGGRCDLVPVSEAELKAALQVPERLAPCEDAFSVRRAQRKFAQSKEAVLVSQYRANGKVLDPGAKDNALVEGDPQDRAVFQTFVRRAEKILSARAKK